MLGEVNFGGKQPNDKKQKILGQGEFAAAAIPLWFSDVTPKKFFSALEKSWDSWEDGSSETLSATDGGGSVAGGSGQHEIRRESFLF